MDTMFTDRLRIKDLEETLANSTPLLAVVGAGDFAVEKIRAARGELVSRSTSFDPKAFREQAQATFAERVAALQTEMEAAPEQIKALPEKAQEWPARAQALFADAVSTAFSTYSELAGRGKTVVQHARGERVTAEHITPVSRPAAKTTTTKSTTTTTATKKPAAKKTSTATQTATAKKTTTAKKTSPVKKTTTATKTTTAAKKPAAKSTSATRKTTTTTTSTSS